MSSNITTTLTSSSPKADRYVQLMSAIADINSELDFDRLIKRVVEESCAATDSDRGALFIYDQQQDLLWTKHADGLGHREIRTDRGIAFRVAQTQMPYLTNLAARDPHFDKRWDRRYDYQTKSILAVPIMSKSNQVLAVLQVLNKNGSGYGAKDIHYLELIGKHIAVAIENAYLFQEVKKSESYREGLLSNLDTGVLTTNRKGYIEYVNDHALQMLDMPLEKLLHKNISGLLDTGHTFLIESQYAVLKGNAFSKSGVILQRENGKKSIADVKAMPYRNIDEEVIGAINIITDVTKDETIKRNLSRYMPEHVAEGIMTQDAIDIFKPKSQKASILFSDIRGFTSMTERLGPTQIVSLLNQYYSEMVNVVFENNGIIDKFIGDALMAIYGVPKSQTCDAGSAVQTAKAMLEQLRVFNTFRPPGLQLEVGVGISTGKIISGNLGSHQRYEYTVIGSPVNLASRLQDLTKTYKKEIVICEDTYREVKDLFKCSLLDTVYIKGLSNHCNIYSVG